MKHSTLLAGLTLTLMSMLLGSPLRAEPNKELTPAPRQAPRSFELGTSSSQYNPLTKSINAEQRRFQRNYRCYAVNRPAVEPFNQRLIRDDGINLVSLGLAYAAGGQDTCGNNPTLGGQW